MRDLPSVSIVIVNLNGRYLLRDCLKSILSLDYPKENIEVIVVDNGSTDGSIEFLHKNYNWVKIIRNKKNEGFAKPSNDGARAANGQYVAFLNSDMRVEKEWLIELANTIKVQKAQCAASVILSWNGDMLDFAGGSINFYGLGYQYDFHVPVSQMKIELEKDREILFACGGAMMVERELFLDTGGFDEDYFAYFEDVDFGWRFTILGYKTVLSVKSRVCHKHNGTSSFIAKERIRKLCARNNLYTIFKNYGENIFNRVMLPTILLNLHDTFTLSEIDAENYDIASDAEFDGSPVRINHMAAVKFTALDDLSRNSSKMLKKRQEIQAKRKISDDELLRFITNPFIVFPNETAELINTEYDFIKAFKLDEAFKTEFKTKVLLVSGNNEQNVISKYESMAKVLASSAFEVTLCCREGDCDGESGVRDKDGYNHLPFINYDDEKLLEAVKTVQIIVADIGSINDESVCNKVSLKTFAKAAEGKYLVADISTYNIGNVAADFSVLDVLLRLGDLVICADSGKKADYLSLISSAQKLNPGAYSFNKSADEIFTTVTLEDGAESLVAFCKNPLHLIIEENNADDGLNFSDDEEDGSQLNGLILRRLGEIEKQQKSMAEIVKKSSTVMVETERDVKEVLEQSNLMNSRFQKLKSSLTKFRLFSRLFK